MSIAMSSYAAPIAPVGAHTGLRVTALIPAVSDVIQQRQTVAANTLVVPNVASKPRVPLTALRRALAFDFLSTLSAYATRPLNEHACNQLVPLIIDEVARNPLLEEVMVGPSLDFVLTRTAQHPSLTNLAGQLVLIVATAAPATRAPLLGPRIPTMLHLAEKRGGLLAYALHRLSMFSPDLFDGQELCRVKQLPVLRANQAALLLLQLAQQALPLT